MDGLSRVNNGRSSKTLGLAVLAAVALAARLAAVGLLWGEHDAPLTYEHGAIARNLLEGRGFSVWFLGSDGPTSQQAPLYPLLVAGVYACLGIESPSSLLAIQLVQCLAGAALALATAWLAWALLPQRRIVGWAAGWTAALHPVHVYMATHVQVAPWAALAVTLLLALVAEPRWRGRWSTSLVGGGLAGLVLLVDPILAVAMPVCGLVYLLGARGIDRGGWRMWFGPLAKTAAMTLAAIVVIAPWLLRNRHVHGEWVFVKSTFGYAFWQGNNPHSHGTDKIPKPSAETLRHDHDGTLAGMNRALWQARHETLYIDDVLLKPTGYREFAGLSEPERSRLLARRAVEFIRQHPDRYAALCLARLKAFLLFDQTNPKAANRAYRAVTVVWLVLAVVGLLASRKLWGQLWPTWAVFAAVAVFHTLTIVSARFRIPVEPLSLVWVAIAVAPPATRLARRLSAWRVVRPPHTGPLLVAQTQHGPQPSAPLRRARQSAVTAGRQ